MVVLNNKYLVIQWIMTCDVTAAPFPKFALMFQLLV
eukprot:CAMPEP_0171323358 /NCGR_PEP_ID=MMETSP0816-20121228/115526_1 /TAXON_ID=420281 /ORGANISM="Proboscia inermis, Strain CCAP1064/1" /LENGTH=35 /DNA_ID= /DNA_START= /DNA_END= /DNA_ORIENTATION=